METEKIYQCFDCPDGVQIFTTEDELMAHKWDMIRTEMSREHMNCHICSLKHRTFEGLIRHYQLSHPARQKLACPGCRAIFPRLYLLMQHMEGNDCPGISAAEVGDRRMRKALAAAAAGSASSAASEIGIFDVGGRVPAGGYGQYMGLDVALPSAVDGGAGGRGSGSGSGSGSGGTNRETPRREILPPASATASASLVPVATSTSASASALVRTARDFRHGDSKLPDLLTDSPANGRHRGLDVWSGQDMLGLGASSLAPEPGHSSSAQQKQQKQQQQKQGTGSPAGHRGFPQPPHELARQPSSPSPSSSGGVGEALDPSHPSHPDFDVFRYKNSITGRFNCPHMTCRRAGKTFKSASSFITHLRSDAAHSSLRVQCPSCSRYFTTIQALVQHSESQSTRCHLRDSEEFHQFLDTLTGGMVAVQGRNIDLTVSYAVQSSGTARDLLQDGEAVDM